VNDRDLRVKLLRRAYENGVTFYDTADVYGDGKGETLLQEALGDHRENIVIATKFGYDFHNYPGVQPGQRERPHDWTPAFLRKACEESLQRLGTDYIDLYQLHNPRIDALMRDDLFATLDELKQEGKIRHIGAALGPAIDPRQSEEAVFGLTERKMTSVQIIYNLLEQQLGAPVFEAARKTGGGVAIRVPHSSGLLEGNFHSETDFSSDDHRYFRINTTGRRREWLDEGLMKVDHLQFLVERTHRTLGQSALQFVWCEPSIATALPNIYEEKQLDEFCAAADTEPLTQEEYNRIQSLYRSNFGIRQALAV
jgi:aryl-alcohol dehydrogenase-like predicted oxidoreductase